MISTKNNSSIKVKKEKKEKKGTGKYQSVSKGNTIISFYCPTELQDVLDDRRGKIPRSIFIVEILKRSLGVVIKEE